MNPYRILFMGTPEFSVPTLTALHTSHRDVVAVVTMPDRPKGRGRILVPPPVKETAITLDYPVLQPTQINEPSFVERIIALEPNILVVVAFGHLLPRSFLSIPSLGAINIHASLLPKYRGAAPIQWAIINEEKETGVTTMWMDEGMDTGDILLSRTIPIMPDDTSGSLHPRLAEGGAELLIQTLDELEAGSLVGTPQNHEEASFAPSLKKKDGWIDWTRDAASLEAFIRGMNPWPGAFTNLSGKGLKVFMAKALKDSAGEDPGTVLESFPGDFVVAAGRGTLALQEVQLESGKRLRTEDFLRGCSVPPGTRLG
jgi:methionyl-tRNA formyltransferase